MEADDVQVDDTYDFADDSAIGVPTAEVASPGNSGDPLEILYNFHPESILDYVEKIMPNIAIQQIPPSSDGKDVAHRSQPFLSVYEKTKLLGFRANQLAQGHLPT